MLNNSFFQARVLLAVLLSGLACTGANAAVTVLGVQYQQDELFPEFDCIWHDKNYPTSCSGTYLGGNLHVYLKNTGASSIAVSDMTLAGYSVNTVLVLNSNDHDARSVFYNWDDPYAEAPALNKAAGMPVWFKGDS